MRSTGLLLDVWRRVDEICEDWAVWFSNDRAESPALESGSTFDLARSSGRQWEPTWRAIEDVLGDICQSVDVAIDELAEPHRIALHAWAWENHYRRQSRSGVFKTNRATIEEIDLAKEALVPRLRARGLLA